MGKHFSLTTTDSHSLGAYRADPAGNPKGALVVAHFFAIRNQLAVGLVALVLSIASQAGDLFESRLKREFDAKDASGLIPGHGGVMDRLDGFIFASVVAALIGVARGGLEMPGAGLLVW